MTVGQEPGDSTMIRISTGTKEALNALKINKNEAIGDVVKRLILDNRRLQHKEREPVPINPAPNSSGIVPDPSA